MRAKPEPEDLKKIEWIFFSRWSKNLWIQQHRFQRIPENVLWIKKSDKWLISIFSLQVKIWFQNRRMKWKRSKKSAAEAKEAAKTKPELDQTKGHNNPEKFKVEKEKPDVVTNPPVEESMEQRKQQHSSPVEPETDENVDSNEIIDVGGRPGVTENGKGPLLDQSNLHRDIPTDLSRLAVTQQQHPINPRL